MAGRPKTRARKARALAVQVSSEDFEKFKAAGIKCGFDSDTMERLVARCQGEMAGRRFEATGPAPIYKLTTLLWLHGHGGAEFEVWL